MSSHLHTLEIDSQLQGIATPLALNFIDTVLDLLASVGPVVLPQQGTDGQCRTATEVEIGLPVERRNLDTLVDNGTPEVSGSSLAVTSGNHHATTTVIHVAPYIIDIGPLDRA